ncbi:MAG: Asp23/Gls24 family envelope stress response protein [bacterium]|nr:Asp23/Gls24 family envelope stress response protein [bacterium]
MEEKKRNDLGSVRLSNEVVGTIAGLAAQGVKGVAGMSSGIIDGLAKMLTGDQLMKGIKVEVGTREAALDIFIIAEYGVRIPEVAWRIQQTVKQAVEDMTGLSVVEVNIYVQGIYIEKEKDAHLQKRVS